MHNHGEIRLSFNAVIKSILSEMCVYYHPGAKDKEKTMADLTMSYCFIASFGI